MRTVAGWNKGSDNPAWKGGAWKEERICRICGKDFIGIATMVNSDKYRHKGLYCSRECYSKSRIKPKVGIECKQCGKTFKVIPAKVEKATFCSVTCKAEWQSDNPRQGTKWRDGKSIDKKHMLSLWRIQGSIKRARKRNAEGQFTEEEWINLKREYGNRCPSCNLSEPGVKLTVDHVIPLSQGGTNWISNIQPLCRSCNSKKMMKTTRFTADSLQGIA